MRPNPSRNCSEAHADPYLNPRLYYWAREARTSNAEVDYLVSIGSRILPLEVKAGKSGTLRSLHSFLQECQPPPWGFGLPRPTRNFRTLSCSASLYAMGKLNDFLEKLTEK